MTADQIIEALGLAPHPEGGFYAETWRAQTGRALTGRAQSEGRAAGTAIYFLLRGSDSNHWHKVDAAEIWHHYAGAPLDLLMSPDENGPAIRHRLGPDLASGARPQVIVPPGHWQRAVCTGDYTLVGCTVSPGFEFDRFTLAPVGFDIPLSL